MERPNTVEIRVVLFQWQTRCCRLQQFCTVGDNLKYKCYRKNISQFPVTCVIPSEMYLFQNIFAVLKKDNDAKKCLFISQIELCYEICEINIFCQAIENIWPIKTAKTNRLLRLPLQKLLFRDLWLFLRQRTLLPHNFVYILSDQAYLYPSISELYLNVITYVSTTLSCVIVIVYIRSIFIGFV